MSALNPKGPIPRLIVLSLLFGIAATGPAQAATTKLQGIITSAGTGEPLRSASVYIPLIGRGVASGDDGRFLIDALKPGIYAVEVSLIGYTKWRGEEIEITADGRAEISVALVPTVLPLGEEIIVQGRRPLVEISEPSTRRVITGAELTAGPARTLTEVVRRQVGVTTVDRELHIRGARTYETEYQVDGVSVTDPFLRQGMAVRPPTGAVEVLSVQTGGLDAGDGAASAGVVQVETRRPGTRLSGTVTYRTDHLSPVDEGDWNSDELELTLSGPLRLPIFGFDDRDEHFVPGFLLSLGGRLTDTHLGNGSPNSSIWGGTRWVPRSDNDYHALGKLTWRLNPRHSLTLLFSGETAIDQDRSVIDTRLRTATYSYGWPLEYARHLENYNTFTRQANMQMARWEYRPNERSTLSLTGARVFSRLHSDVQGKDPEDYVAPDDLGPVIIEPAPDSSYFTVRAGDGFYDVGDGDLWYDHFVETYSAKSEYALRPQNNWEVESGLETEFQTLQVIDIFRPWLGTGGLNTDHYRVSPASAVWWGQTRVNFDGAIVDFGLRGEVWFPGRYLEDAVADTTLPNITRGMRADFDDQTFDLFGRRARGWLLPRLGVSYAVGPSASIFVTYDRLARRPTPRYLYAKLRTRSPATFQLFGNPALDLEKTTAFEGGIRLQVKRDLAFTVTAYQREITDYIAATAVIPDPENPSDFWYAYFNQDQGESRGVEFTLKARSRDGFTGTAMAALSRVKAAHSLPSDIFRGVGTRTAVLVQEVRLDWDKPWRLGLDAGWTFDADDKPELLGISLGSNWSLNISFWAEAGKRYTPYGDSLSGLVDTVYFRTGEPNSQLGPYWSSLDIAYQKRFPLGQSTLSLIVEISNLFNHRNITLVNPLTGEGYAKGDQIPTGDNFFETPPAGYDLPIWDDPARYDQPTHWQIALKWEW